MDEAIKNIKSAIEFHIDGLLEDGEDVPPPTTIGKAVEVEIAA